MSMRRRYEPMGGEGDSSHVRVPSTDLNDNNIEEVESHSSDSFVDDLALRVRALLMSLDDADTQPSGYPQRVQEDVQQNSTSQKHGSFAFRETKEPHCQGTSEHHGEKGTVHDHNSFLCSVCSQLGLTEGADGENAVFSRSSESGNTVVLVPQAARILPQAPEIAITDSSPSKKSSCPTDYVQKGVENPSNYQLFSSTLNENLNAVSSNTAGRSQDSVKSMPKMHSDAPRTVESLSSRTSNVLKHKFCVQPSRASTSLTNDQHLEKETERSWSEIIISPESLSKDTRNSGMPSLADKSNTNLSFKGCPPKQIFLLPKTVSRRNQSVSPRHLTGGDADVPADWKSNASAVVDKEYEFLNYQSLSSMSDFDSVGRDTPPLSASSIGSSKRLEWDNGADIGYSIANANSKLRRMVPNTARSEPEGISLINDTLNNTANVTPISFPSSIYPDAEDDSTSRQILTNSVSCETKDDLDRSSSPEASLSRSDSKRSVIYNSGSVEQPSKSSTSNLFLLEKVPCHSFKNQSCPDLTSLVPTQKLSKASFLGTLSKSDEGVSLSQNTQARQEANLPISNSPTANHVSERLEKNDNYQLTQYDCSGSSHSKNLLGERSFNDTSLTCNCQQSHSVEKESKYYIGSESEKSYKSREEHESFELTSDGGDRIYNIAEISHSDANVDWIGENAMFDPSVHYIANMSELSGNCPINSLNPGSFLLLSNNPSMNGSQLSRNVGNILSDDNSNEYSSSVENKPHIRWYPFSSVNAQDIKNVSTQTAMSFIAEQVNEAPVQVASEQQTTSPEAIRFTSEESSDDSMKDHTNEGPGNPLGHLNSFKASKKSEDAASCFRFHSSTETVLAGQNVLKGHAVNPELPTSTALPINQEIPIAGSATSFRKHSVNSDNLTSVELSRQNIFHTYSSSDAFIRDNEKEVISPSSFSDHEDLLIHQNCQQQSKNLRQISTPLDLVKTSEASHRTFCWLTEKKEDLGDRSDITSSPDLYNRERKLGVGQCETVSRSGTVEEAAFDRSKMFHTSLKHPYSSSDSDAINYPESGGFSNSDVITDSDSPSRSSVEGYSSGESRKQYLLTIPSAKPVSSPQRYYFSNISPVNIYGDGRSDVANQDASKPGRSKSRIDDSNQGILRSGIVTSLASGDVSASKAISSANSRHDATGCLKNVTGVKPSTRSVIDNANRAISDFKVIASAARRLNATDLYSQSQPITPFKTSSNLEKSSSGSFISLQSRTLSNHKSNAPQATTPLDFNALSSNEKMKRSKVGQTDCVHTAHSERCNADQGSGDHFDVKNHFESLKHSLSHQKENDTLLQINSYEKRKNDQEFKVKLAESYFDCSSYLLSNSQAKHSSDIMQTNPFIDHQRGENFEGKLSKKHSMDALLPTFQRVPEMDISDTRQQGAVNFSSGSKPKVQSKSTNPTDLSSGSRIDARQVSMREACSEEKFNRNIHSEHFSSWVVDRDNTTDHNPSIFSKHPSSPRKNSKKLHTHHHHSSPSFSETDNVQKYLRTFEKQYVSIGLQVSRPASRSKLCHFCNRSEESSYRHDCYGKDVFKDKLNHVLEEKLDLFKKRCGKSGASFCVFPSGCVCCCSKTLQEAFNIHRSELAERIQARKNDVMEQARKKHVINLPSSGNYNKKELKNVSPRTSNKEKSSNKENKSKLKRNHASPRVTANKLKERQRSLLTLNRVMSKIYSQRLKDETLKGKVNFQRHENLIA